jgi:hypothetical protein
MISCVAPPPPVADVGRHLPKHKVEAKSRVTEAGPQEPFPLHKRNEIHSGYREKPMFGRTAFSTLLRNDPAFGIRAAHRKMAGLTRVAHRTANAGIARRRMEVSHASQSAFVAHPGCRRARSLRQRSNQPAKRRDIHRSPTSARQLGTGESNKPTGGRHCQPGDDRGATHVPAASGEAAVAVASADRAESCFARSRDECTAIAALLRAINRSSAGSASSTTKSHFVSSR